MSKITSEDVKKIALLARLDVSNDRIGSLTEQMNGILGYIETLGELNTDGVEPTSHAIPLGTAWRDDKAKECPNPDKALDNSPEKSEGFIVVPRIIE